MGTSYILVYIKLQRTVINDFKISKHDRNEKLLIEQFNITVFPSRSIIQDVNQLQEGLFSELFLTLRKKKQKMDLWIQGLQQTASYEQRKKNIKIETNQQRILKEHLNYQA